MFYYWLFTVFLAAIMVFKKDNNTDIKKFIQWVIGSGLLLFVFYCGNFYAEYHYDKKERKLQDTIDILSKLLPIPTKYKHVIDVHHMFFPKGQTLYMGWLHEVKTHNLYGGLTLDITENGDSIPLKEKNCSHALGMFPNEYGIGLAEYNLNKRCSEFKADILLVKSIKLHENDKEDPKHKKGVKFRIYGNDNKTPLYNDSIVDYNKPKSISIRIDSVNVLRLEVESMIKGDNWGANSCWANARVILK